MFLGVHINYDYEVLRLVWQSGVRSWNKRLARFLNNFHNGIYPSSVEFLLTILSIVVICNFIFQIDPSFGVVRWLDGEIVAPLFSLQLSPNGCVFAACLIYGIVLWLAKMLVMRYTLKILLMYKGWMYQSRGGACKFLLLSFCEKVVCLTFLRVTI